MKLFEEFKEYEELWSVKAPVDGCAPVEVADDCIYIDCNKLTEGLKDIKLSALNLSIVTVLKLLKKQIRLKYHNF